MLANKLKDYRITLASASPRRQNLLKELNVPFSIEVRKVKEVYPEYLKAQKITDYLAELKSKAFTNLNDNELIITSDTIVWFDGKAMGKPKNKEQAITMLQSLSGKSHSVFTSICLKSNNFTKIFGDETLVEFEDLSNEEINFYLNQYKPFDKAGSYGIQDWIGLIGVKKIVGSYFNVMGLPVHKLYKELMNLP